MTEPASDPRPALVDALEQLAAFAQRAGSPSLHDRLENDRLPRLREGRLVLVVLGEFNHGKTTFVNALLGAPVLPAGITPTTAVIHEVRHGDTPSATLVLRDRLTAGATQTDPGTPRAGERREIPWDAIGGFAVGGTEHAEDVLRVEITHPTEFLRQNVTLVDTPGVNDLNQQRAEITYGYVPRADAVVFLLDAGQILKESERTFLADKLLGAGRDRIVFAVNKIDLLDASERAEVMAYAATQLARLVPGAPLVALSAQRALDGDRVGSGFEALEHELSRLLGEHRLRMLVDHAADEGRRVAAMLRAGLHARRRACTMTSDELARRITALEQDLADARKRTQARAERIAEEIAVVKAVAQRDLRAFTEDFAARIVPQIESQSAEDVRTHLADFIEESWRHWVEREGALMGERLERLAEEIVAFVNEDARTAGEKLTDLIGEHAPTVDVKVDTLAYDASVFALGAVGMGLVLASNFLVGGLLTLAAPALAFVFRGRVDKEIKQKALENAPRVIRDVARRIEPELLGTVDDFGEKLSAFLTEATDDMRRSMLEMLHATQDALRAANAGEAPTASAVDAQIAALDAIDQRVAAVRDV